MYIFSTFEHSAFLELAITALEQKGVPRKRILAVPLNMTFETPMLFDTINSADGISMFDGAAALGTAFMILGVIYGYVLAWGPILCGLIGLGLGAVFGYLLDIIPKKKKPGKVKTVNGNTEVVVVVNCDERLCDVVETILRNNMALGIGRFDRKES